MDLNNEHRAVIPHGPPTLADAEALCPMVEAAILTGALDALLATLDRTTDGDPNATYPDLWHGLRHEDGTGFDVA